VQWVPKDLLMAQQVQPEQLEQQAQPAKQAQPDQQEQ
jgi:hypothetical protein